MMNGIARLQQARFEGFDNAQDKMESAMERAEKRHQAAIDESYQQALVEIENNKQAREKKSIFTMIFAIVLGPLIGSAVGNAIGEAVNDGDEADAQAAKRKTALADEDVQESWDQVKDLQEDIDDVRDQAERIRQVSQELDEIGWASVTK